MSMRRQCLTKSTSQPSSPSQIIFSLLSLPYMIVSPGMDCVYNISLHLPHLVCDQLCPFSPPEAREQEKKRWIESETNIPVGHCLFRVLCMLDWIAERRNQIYMTDCLTDVDCLLRERLYCVLRGR
ncbi:hypothetical protein I7I48_06950 [Histoplasma ohiense]|nr:hypothetical protein I7I48_06950 [Histoplasma ohiense (nom. inval.)]